MKDKSIPLRQRKAAQTRLTLLEALLSRLDERSLAEISVKELCAEVPCSEPTFFNHFESKEQLLVFFIQLWSVEMAWRGKYKLNLEHPLEAIEEIFVQTARYTVSHPGIMCEILAFQARTRAPQITRKPTRADILLAHPDKEGIEELESENGGLDALLPPLLTAAVSQGLLPENTDIQAVFFALGSIFFGTAVLGRQAGLALIEPFYRQQLHWLWTALRAQSGEVA